MTARRSFGLHAIVAEGLLSRLSFGLIAFVLPLYARGLGLSIAEIGVLTALNSAASVLLKPAMGWAADRFGLKRAFVTSVGLRSLVSLLLVVAGAAWQLYPIRVLHGLSAAPRDPAANVLIAEQGGERQVASAFAWYQTAKTAAGSVSKALGGLLLALFAANYSAVFLVAFALSALPLLVVVLFVPDARPHAVERPAEPAPEEIGREVEEYAAACLGTVLESLLGRTGAPWRVSNGHVLNFVNTLAGAAAAPAWSSIPPLRSKLSTKCSTWSTSCWSCRSTLASGDRNSSSHPCARLPVWPPSAPSVTSPIASR